jgi:hypothetical protein
LWWKNPLFKEPKGFLNESRVFFNKFTNQILAPKRREGKRIKKRRRIAYTKERRM